MNVTKYRQYRSKGVAATVAAEWARTPELSEQWPGVMWTGGWYAPGDGYALRNGYRVEIALEYDEVGGHLGTFTDFPGDAQTNAVLHPEWRPGSALYRWYLPVSTLEEHREGLRALGYARHEAWRLAREYVREEALDAASSDWYGIRVRVYDPEGNEVGHESLWGICLRQAEGRNGNEYAMSTAADLIEDAMPDYVPAIETV